MKKYLFSVILCSSLFAANAITPFERVYTTLNTKCQNSTCHSATSGEALKFDGDLDAVYASIFEVLPQNASSVAKNEKLVKQGHPYMSFLLRKIAGAGFDSYLAIDSASEGALMLDINGNKLENKEIEFIRQWIMHSALKTYPNSATLRVPDWQLVSDYYDNPAVPFLQAPPKPTEGTGMQFRMGPIFLPVSGETEQEYMTQQEVNFPYLAEINKIEGFMNAQSHHFLLFKFDDSTAARNRSNAKAMGLELVSLTALNTSFDGDKVLTASWQDDRDMELPRGTALFWPKKTYLDMNYHIKNYNSPTVLPCDFYFNIYFKPRDPNTIEMKSSLVNNSSLFLWPGVRTVDYNDGDNNSSNPFTKYIWMTSTHTHQYGTDFDLLVRDANGQLTEIYDGHYDYDLDVDKGFWDYQHPPIRRWENLLPVQFGRSGNNRMGLVARTTYDIPGPLPVTFSFQTTGEMQLFYYMYTDQPLTTTAINDVEAKGIFFDVMPNPMNGTGKLVYNLDKAAKVESNIIDMTGKTIAKLTEENETAGLHEITIGNNERLSAGIYFARLVVDGVTYTKKFIITE